MKIRFKLLTVLVVIGISLVSSSPLRAQGKSQSELSGTVSADSSAKERGRIYAHQKRLLGTVSVEGGRTTFITRVDKRTWTVMNPKALKNLDGQNVQIFGQFYRDSNSIHVVRVRTFRRSEEAPPPK
jgi:hypothetical protein